MFPLREEYQSPVPPQEPVVVGAKPTRSGAVPTVNDLMLHLSDYLMKETKLLEVVSCQISDYVDLELCI